MAHIVDLLMMLATIDGVVVVVVVVMALVEPSLLLYLKHKDVVVEVVASMPLMLLMRLMFCLTWTRD